MFLGIDIGTSEVKALLLSDDHRIIGSAGTPLTVQRPHPGHSEQAPADWWAATQSALLKLQAAHPAEYAAARAIGLSGQMHGAVLLDAQDRVLRPAILWNDTRCAAECAEMMAELPTLTALAGTLAMPGFTAPKLRWVAKHEPEVFQQVAKVLLPKDYVRLMLTGEYACDMSDASGTLWLDVQQRDWSDALLALTDLNRSHMPRLVEGSAPGGYLKADVAQALGLNAGIVVAGGAGDNAASAVGMGAVDSGQGFLSLGTSGVLFVVTPSYQPNAASATHAFCHAVPGRWHQMSVMLSAASSLQWVTDLLGAPNAGVVAEKAAALSAAQRAASPLFLPYLGGERTPHNDANVRGSFHQLSFDTDAARLGYAVIEGVTFGLKDGLAALNAAGSSVHRLSLVGGGARSSFWAQQLASALNVDIVTHGSSAVGGALGAARLGWLATGADAAAVCLTPEVDATYHPDAAEQALLMDRYATFRSLYRTV
ncbi:MAG: xylulokinase [Curvibacter sp. RIFCSPHIGHO2_12_FULL_63_18]|uniref:xylulokinase n=1 Tax=Rhodoferax sp. TaxID=50421 RepID=UPI0008C80A83|nr:xylulokinase [Rhodoferax sp.]OGO99558.1 MAG: xylulokinase [Curvibacter sp. GWA2_63_95]OGP04605.1 MAG: xylulokinase [Curvibacter sp. RIFCSPHIGHO2_12_FULL_63_18]HCX80907.1 xylulokinase [Rhodoferax sp.]